VSSEAHLRALAIARAAGGTAVVLSAVILLVFSALRLSDMGRNPPATDAFGERYAEHPRLTMLHIIPGLLFLTLGALQFVPRIRQRHIRIHRRLGWFLVACAATSGVCALLVSSRFPAFGGVSTQAATVFFGAIFLGSLAKAIRCIRRRQVALHREWMIRTFALAMGVATIRLYIAFFTILSHYRFLDIFGAAFWLGFATNLLVAEIWINESRQPNIVVDRGRRAKTEQTA